MMTASPDRDSGNVIRVLVVDDSALIRKLLTELLQSDPSIEVIGSARDAYAARDMIKKFNPDVITLDVEMPRMDGLTFLKNLMRLRPMPVVMVSSLTERGAEVTLSALDMGAVDFVSKPKIDLEHGMRGCADEIIGKIKTAAVASVSVLARNARRPDKASKNGSSRPRPVLSSKNRTTDQIIAIGASTGGTEAIKEVLEQLPADAPGIVITQHIPPTFSRSFAERMNRCSEMEVCEAQDDQLILTGHAYIAPGDQHLRVIRDGARYRCRLGSDAPVSGHRPSVDVMFDSVTESAGRNAVGVILTGMGRDGAKGLKRLRDSGADTLGQDKDSCVVWGMPKVAVEVGAVKDVLPLSGIASRLREISK